MHTQGAARSHSKEQARFYATRCPGAYWAHRTVLLDSQTGETLTPPRSAFYEELLFEGASNGKWTHVRRTTEGATAEGARAEGTAGGSATAEGARAEGTAGESATAEGETKSSRSRVCKEVYEFFITSTSQARANGPWEMEKSLVDSLLSPNVLDHIQSRSHKRVKTTLGDVMRCAIELDAHDLRDPRFSHFHKLCEYKTERADSDLPYFNDGYGFAEHAHYRPWAVELCDRLARWKECHDPIERFSAYAATFMAELGRGYKTCWAFYREVAARVVARLGYETIPGSHLCIECTDKGDMCALNRVSRVEKTIARLVRARMSKPTGRGREILEVSDKSVLTGSQSRARDLARTEWFSVVMGGAGTGKSHVIGKVVRDYLAAGGRVLLVSTMHSAVAVLEMRVARFEVSRTAKKDCKTIRAALFADEDQYDLVVVDEAGMMGLEHCLQLLQKYQSARFMLVGDALQIPSIGAGCPFRDFVECGERDNECVHYTHLSDIQRCQGPMAAVYASLRQHLDAMWRHGIAMRHEGVHLEDLLGRQSPSTDALCMRECIDIARSAGVLWKSICASSACTVLEDEFMPPLPGATGRLFLRAQVRQRRARGADRGVQGTLQTRLLETGFPMKGVETFMLGGRSLSPSLAVFRCRTLALIVCMFG